MTQHVIMKDGQPYTTGTAEECAQIVTQRGWATVERFGTWFVKGIEIVPLSGEKTNGVGRRTGETGVL